MALNKLPLNEIHVASIILYYSARREEDKELRRFKFNTCFKLRRFILKHGFPNSLGTIRPVLIWRGHKAVNHPSRSVGAGLCNKPKLKASSLKKQKRSQ